MVSKETIAEYREKYPLPFDEISICASFEQILGRMPEDFTPEERYKRWARCMELLKQEGQTEAYEYWATTKGSDEMCHGCVLRDNERNWCRWSELPANYNPILKNVGMACGGIGYDGQQQLDI